MKLVLIAGWVMTLVAAFVVGRNILPVETSATTTHSLSDALDSRDYLVRMYGVAKALEGLGPENIDANLAAFEKGHAGLSDTEVRAFMTAWCRFDPEAALAWANGWRGHTKSKFVKTAIWAWASLDPQGAREAFSAIPAGKREEQGLLIELIKGWIRGGDAEGATTYVLSSGGDRKNSMLVNKMAGWIVGSGGVDAVVDWAEGIPEEGDDSWAREVAFRAAMSAVAREDANRATAWYEAHQESGYAGAALKALAFSWMSNGDPAALFEWLQERPEGQLRLETIRQTYRRWLKQDPGAAVDWIRNVTLTPALDPAVAIIARYESRVDVESAIQWADRIEDQRLQRTAIVPILRIWAKEDPDAARAWMVEKHYPESVRNDIVGRLSREAAALREDMDTATEATATATAP